MGIVVGRSIRAMRMRSAPRSSAVAALATGEVSGRASLTGELAEQPGPLCRGARAIHARKKTSLAALERGLRALCGDEESGS
jgi:hypothetical protein